MSPHNAAKNKTAGRPALAALCLLGLILAAPAAAAPGDAHALRRGDIRRAEKVLGRLRQLYAAADAGDAGHYRALASKFYPGLFVTVAEIRQDDLSTDLSTAVFLAAELARTWSAAGAAAAECGRERPDIYLPLCLDLRGGTRGQLLLAKARLHARWAEAVLRSGKGEVDAETARALSEMAAARVNDMLLAARVVEVLRPLEGLLRRRAAGAEGAGRLGAAPAGPGGESDRALRTAGALLGWMPRSQTFYRLSGARLAYADGLSWLRMASLSKRLVVSARSFEPSPLEALGLDAEQAAAAAEANWRSAARITRIATQNLASGAER